MKSKGFGAVREDDFVRVARALLPADEAEEVILTFKNGWFGYTPNSPLILGLAVVSREAAEALIEIRPDLEAQLKRLRQDPEAALSDIRHRMAVGWKG